jgi:hypothetical protein
LYISFDDTGTLEAEASHCVVLEGSGGVLSSGVDTPTVDLSTSIQLWLLEEAEEAGVLEGGSLEDRVLEDDGTYDAAEEIVEVEVVGREEVVFAIVARVDLGVVKADAAGLRLLVLPDRFEEFSGGKSWGQAKKMAVFSE